MVQPSTASIDDPAPRADQVERARAESHLLLKGGAAGLIAGLLASFVMDRFQATIAELSSSHRGGEPATDKAASAISKAVTGQPLAESDRPFGGQAVHYALGAGLGMVYGIAAEYRPVVTAGCGTAFGIGVAALLDEAAVPAVGLTGPPWKTALSTHVYSLTSHLVFGAVAEITRRQVRATL